MRHGSAIYGFSFEHPFDFELGNPVTVGQGWSTSEWWGGEKKGKRFESGMRWLRDNVLREMMKIKRREWNIVEIED